MTRTKVGLVGTGYWARQVHAAALAVHPDLEFVGIWGRDRERADEAGAPHGVPGYDDFDALLAEVDVLAFAVPPSVQSELAVRAAEAGKHLFLEKPIALDLASADRLVAAVDERGLSTVVFFTSRFVPVWENWLDSIAAAGVLGGRADWLSSQTGKDNPYVGSAWRRENGALWDVGPHQLAQLIPALGPVVDIAGARGVGDLVHLILTHEGGATSRMSLGQGMPKSAVRFAVEFYGEDGWSSQPEDPRDVGKAYARAVDELLANIAAGETAHRCGVHFARDVVEVITRCEAVLGRR
ncbi:gfo/Idh/MocA family oxidoreductase [Nocardioides marmoriginsengisoli]|uniref:Gfo/Idh/MocA family oxidoreductase n=1 Tax=Nocardioides marmoriginsengisoli TaxID=661483 RepID=A0A3N0CR68_9ACTN|nr:Gfo/Idh/MocA family oxidoreductase [Nocardioides marmoriginsengisoli]RNL65526.1 gfo/Idh/MocA family oxidoreductase [Nocardioides marmoriginsengisoli]